MSEVLFYKSKLFYPLNFAVHTWIVTIDGKKKHRWEFWQVLGLKSKNKNFKSFGMVYRNLQQHDVGIYRLPRGVKQIFSKNKAIVFARLGGEDAKKIISGLNKFSKKYPYKNKYHYWPGPNSNTFIQWIVDKTGVRIKLPWNAFGKNYGRGK